MSNLDTLLLSDDQHRRYMALLAERGIDHSGVAEIPRRPKGARVPLCSYQEPLWFIDRYSGGDTAHNVVYPMGLPEGRIDRDALKGAIERMVSRHEILRTTFRQDDDLVVQVVHDKISLTLDEVDLSGLSEEQREAAGWKLVDDEAAHQFDLERGNLIKFTLLVAAPDKNVLIVSLHHIVCDTWSVAIIDREVRTHYHDIANGRPCSMPPVELQFGDYATWQKSTLGEGARAKRDMDYWTRRLLDVPALQLPLDYPVPEQRTHAAANSLVYVDEALLERAKAYAQTEGVTLYMVLLAAFKIMLSRHTGQADIVVGTPHANREHEQMRDLIGFTINSLVLRTDLGGRPDFRAAVQRVKATALQAYEHQGVPFQSIVEKLGASGKAGASLSRYSLFRAFFSVQNIRWADIELPQINTGALHSKPRFTVPHPTTKYDIYMYLRERDGKVLGGLEYDVELFKPSRIERMVRHFLLILEEGVADPGTPIHQLAMLSPMDRQILDTFGRGESKGASIGGTDIYSAFQAAVASHPDEAALVEGDRPITYRALAQAVERFGGAEFAQLPQASRVGLVTDRSSQMVVALLALLRQGACCVPLDHSAPSLRTQSALLAYGLDLVLCDRGADVPAGTNARFLFLDEVPQAEPLEPRLPASPLQAAFLFLTSGSTGVPNGVELTHAGVLNGQLPQTAFHPIGAGDRLLLNAPASSARLLGELLWPLVNGAAVVLCKPEGHQDPEYLGGMLHRHAITHVSLVPQVMAQMLDAGVFEDCPSLKLVYCVGQNLDLGLATRFAQGSQARLFNTYAQTEVCPVTFQDCFALTGPGHVPVGRAAPNTAVHVLDSNFGKVPVGVTGQIAVAGCGLAQGYPGQSAMTARKFVPDPFGPSGSRMYLTGDLGQWNEDGSLALKGRGDQQIKLRGYRIDLGEVEAALRAVPGVQEAVVLSPLEDGVPIITAFAAEGPACPLSGAEPAMLRSALQRRLPFYMLPSRIVVLEAIPRGRTGKPDHDALLERLSTQPQNPGNGEPRNDIERKLVDIWREILELPASRRLSVFDSFFELGGHSLMAIKMVKRIHSRLNVKLEIRQIFEAVSIAGLADLIEWELSADSFEDVVID